jgi:enoyl-CoA hydratase
VGAIVRVTGGYARRRLREVAAVAIETCEHAVAQLDVVPELLEEGRALVEELRPDPPRALVITGAGEFFSGGVDLNVAPTLSVEEQREMVAGINQLFASWYGFWRPVVAAVNGHAVAGGLILALCADHRVGAEGARYGLTEARVGIPYPAAAIGVVKAEVAPDVARRLVLGAELIDAALAREWGLMDELALAEGVLERALEVARRLAELPPNTFAEVKRQLRGRAFDAISAAIEEDPLGAGWLHSETSEAARVMLSRRPEN